jgi:pimeloyl-ACP methyl ester carboxylesterase
MERRLGDLCADVVSGEGEKFTAPLLFAHGVWCGPAIWRPFAGYLAHRGWTCILLDLRAAGASTFEQRRAQLARAVAAVESTPVLIGHDLGALLGLAVAAQARGVMALAPLLLPPAAPPRGLRAATRWWRTLGRGAVGPPRGAGPPSPWEERESPRALRALARGGAVLPRLPADVPAAVLIGDLDRVTPPSVARAFAAQLGAPLHVCAGDGHWLVVEPHWPQRVADIHRWLVRQLGAPLLALYDDTTER